MVGAEGKMASMKQHKVVEDREEGTVLLHQCHPNSAGSLVIARRMECNPIVFFLCVLLATPPNRRKRPRYIEDK